MCCSYHTNFCEVDSEKVHTTDSCHFANSLCSSFSFFSLSLFALLSSLSKKTLKCIKTKEEEARRAHQKRERERERERERMDGASSSPSSSSDDDDTVGAGGGDKSLGRKKKKKTGLQTSELLSKTGRVSIRLSF